MEEKEEPARDCKGQSVKGVGAVWWEEGRGCGYEGRMWWWWWWEKNRGKERKTKCTINGGKKTLH